MMLGIEGRTALVVGASRGIGQEVARTLKAEGCKVIPVSRTHGYDLMPEDGPAKLIEAIRDTPPDIIVHVLGGSQGMTQTLAPASVWAKVWRLNLGIAHELNCAFIPTMQRNRWGRIVHISSNAHRIGTGYCPYACAKAALDGYVKVVSREFSKDGVIIAAVAPGIVHTEGRYYASLSDDERTAYFDKYLPIQRFGRAEEVANLVAYMCSDHSGYMPGSIVAIDGGAR